MQKDFGSNSHVGKRGPQYVDDLNYRQLQKIAKALELPSNLKKQYLLEVIKAKNAGNTAKIEEIVKRAKMEKKGTKSSKKKAKKSKVKERATNLLSRNEGKMFAIKPSLKSSAQFLNQPAVVVQYKENPHKHIIGTCTKRDLLLFSDSNCYENKSVIHENKSVIHENKSVIHENNNDYDEPVNVVNYESYLAKDANQTIPCSNYNTQKEGTSQKRRERSLKSLLLTPDTTSVQHNESEIVDLDLITESPRSYDHIYYTMKKVPLTRKPSVHRPSKIILKKNAPQNTNVFHSIPNLQNRHEKDVSDFNNFAKNDTSSLHPWEKSSDMSLEMQKNNSNYFTKEIEDSPLLDPTSEMLIDSLEKTDINVMADGLLFNDLMDMVNKDFEQGDMKTDTIEIDSNKTNDNVDRDKNSSDDLSYLLPYMDGFDNFTDEIDLDLGLADDNNENLSDLDSLFKIKMDDLYQVDLNVPENIFADKESVISSDETVVLMDNSSQFAETTTVNTEDFLNKVPKVSSPNFINKNNEISFPLILDYLENTESEMDDQNTASQITSYEDTSTSNLPLTSTLQLQEDVISLICNSDIMKNNPDSDTSGCFFCVFTWKGDQLSMDDHIRQYHDNYIQLASDTGFMEHTVSLGSILACPNQCLPVIISAYSTLLFLRVNHQGGHIYAHLTSIPSRSTDHQNISGTIEIFSKDGLQSFVWTGAIQPYSLKNNECSYFNFNPRENCLKVHLPDIGYSATNSDGENENSMLATLENENETEFKFRIKINCTY